MTPVIDLKKSVFREIKKLMMFYNLPDWENLHKFAQGVEFTFVKNFKQ